MIIKRKGKGNIFIENKDDYINYINSIIKNIKKYDTIPFVLDLDKIFQKNLNLYKKSFDKIIKNHFYNLTNLNEKYWIDRGWTSKESIEKIKNIQLLNNNKNIIKQNKLKNDNYNKWSSRKVTNLNYYLSKGFSLDESKKLLKERQNTFNLKKCIEKYGEIKGIEIYENRQKKWINSLSKLNFNTDSQSLSHIINKYGNNWLNIALERHNYNEEYLNIIKYTINNNLDLKNFFTYIYENFDYYTITDYCPLFKSKILQYFYNITFDKFKLQFLKNTNLIINKFGNIRYINNHITRSNGEYEICKYLVNNNIEYIYEKKYPNSKYICDFYLIKKDLYIEYTGFLKSDFLSKTNFQIVEKYTLKLNKKIDFCHTNNINLYYNNNIKNILNKIKDEYEIK